jgi:hypothetical protein
MFRPDAIERFGVLSEPIQVQGAIALAKISHDGMHLDVNRLDKAAAGLRRRVDDLVTELEVQPGGEGLFRRDREGGLVLTEKTRSPSLNQARLDSLLETAAAEVAADTGRPVKVSRTKTGKLSHAGEDWEEIAPFHPALTSWLELGKTTKLLGFFANLSEAVVHPRYAPMVRSGRSSCSSPNVQQVPRKGGFREAFIPSPGHFFLIADYSFVELRTLAAVCEARYGESKLADVIRSGVDPHCYTAAMFEHMILEEFMAMKTSGREEVRERFETLRQRAKVLNFGIPGGLGARSLVAYARSTYGVTLTLEEAGEFRRRLIEEVYPELGLYLADDGMDALARNLGADVGACWDRFDWHGDRSGAVVGGIGRVVKGMELSAAGKSYSVRYLDGVWTGLIALNRNQDLAGPLGQREGGKALFRKLFSSRVTTLTGRVRGSVGFTQARNTPFQGLAADGAKLALWALIRAGYRVVAFVHDEFLIELPEDADHTAEARRVEEIMNRGMEDVTGDVPVACEYALARRWSKRAKAVFDDNGRLLPWEEGPP